MKLIRAVVSVCAPVAMLIGAPAIGGGFTSENPYSTQMHVHASMSEGDGSYSSQLEGAKLAGNDVIWWTEHDHRMSAYHHTSTHSFDARVIPFDDNEPWTPTRGYELTGSKEWLFVETGVPVSFSFPTDNPFEGEASFRMTGASDSTLFTSTLAELVTSGANKRAKRSLAMNVEMGIAIRPDAASEDAFPVVDLLLSLHPANDVVTSRTQYRLIYFLSNTTTEPFRSGATYFVPLPFTLGEWTDYTLPITADAVDGFPFIDGEDNALFEIRVGMRSQNSAAVDARFDAMRITQQIVGQALFEKQPEIMARLADRAEGIVSHHGVEISRNTLQHMIEFSPAPQLADYDEVAALSGTQNASGIIAMYDTYLDFAMRYLVRVAQERGGVVSFCHLFAGRGDKTMEEVRDELLTIDAYGCDILEVGIINRAGHVLPERLWVWDELAKDQLFLAGNGVHDLHGANPNLWVTRENNFTSWIYGADSERETLIESLKRGRLYFGDPAIFDGRVDIVADNGFRMGTVVITDREQVDIQLLASALPSGSTVRLIEYGAHTQTYVPMTPAFGRTVSIDIDPIDGTFARIELYDTSENELAFSNPIYFVRSSLGRPVRNEKLAFDVAGVLSESISGMNLNTITPGTGDVILSFNGGSNTDNGEIRCVLPPSDNGPVEVTFGPMLSGTWSREGDTLTISGIMGRGNIEIVRVSAACPGDCDASGTVDFSDLVCMLFEFQTQGSAADCDASGTVDFADLVCALFAFGPCD